MNSRRTFCRFLCRNAGVWVLLILCGCGGSTEKEFSRAAVTGEVTLDGQPLVEGIIRFVPIDGTPGPKTSVPIADGKFNADEEFGPVVGTHRIEIESTDDGGYAMDDEQALEELQKSKSRPQIHVVIVPAVYNTRSTLKETVRAESTNSYTFSLKTSKRRR